MKFNDLEKFFKHMCFEVFCDDSDFVEGDFVTITRAQDSLEVLIQKSGAPEIKIMSRFVTPKNAKKWEKVKNSSYLAHIDRVQGDRITISVVYDMSPIEITAGISIAVFDKALKIKNSNHAKYFIEDMAKDCCLFAGSDQYILVAKSVYQNNETDELEAFQLIRGDGNAYKVSVRFRSEIQRMDGTTSQDGKVYVIDSTYIPFLKTKQNFVVHLCKTKLELCDKSKAKALKNSDEAIVSNNLEKYVTGWKEYAELEWDLAKRVHDEAGILHYDLLLSDNNDLEGTHRLIANGDINRFIEYLSDINPALEVKVTEITVFNKRKFKNSSFFGRILKRIGNNIFIYEPRYKEQDSFPLTGNIEIDLSGFEEQYNRRLLAFNRMMGGKCPMPGLLSKINGKGAQVEIQARRKFLPVTNYVLKQFGKFPPTEKQRYAIELALNTPDFVVIQGPPGTGKTTVINAIMTALSENDKDKRLSYARNLLTAYQRDATDNLAKKLTIYGLPVPVYKGKQDIEQLDENVRHWTENICNKIIEENPDISLFSQKDLFEEKINFWLEEYNIATASYFQDVEILESLLTEAEKCIPNEAIKLFEWHNLLEEAKRESEYRNNCVPNELQKVKNLPTCNASMSDNGPNFVFSALNFIKERHLTDNNIIKIITILEKEYGNNGNINFGLIEYGKNRLIQEITPELYSIAPSGFNKKIVSALEDCQSILEEESRNDIDSILAKYLYALKYQKSEIESNIKDFLTVIAATHQKTITKNVIKGKGGDPDSKVLEIEFDNVLIDEAARSTPPDLLIPMCCASERIILVGDHKQLPQFISDKVYKELENPDKQRLIQETMFQHLIEQAKRLEQVDGIRRFVTLNKQYRMPKVLADIVSKYFYDGMLESPDKKGSEPLTFGPLKGKNIVWADEKFRAEDRMLKDKRSKSLLRPCEAVRIANLLSEIFQENQPYNKYSYGIITFYSAQRDYIRDELIKNGFLDQDGKNPDGIVIEIGTVDSFQGKEFDIVFLSMVRSFAMIHRKINKYGFTSDEHRLCVALSRAKKCMVIVGDSGMLKGKEAKERIPSLVEFYQICAAGGEKLAGIL